MGIQGHLEKNMSKIETFKRTLILMCSMLGVLLLTLIYGYTWLNVLPGHYVWKINLFFKGHILLIVIYGVLLFFFTSVLGGLRVGYLKPMDVFLSNVFALIIVNIVSYAQISLMELRLFKASPMIVMTVVQIVFAGIWTMLSNYLYHIFFPPRKLLFVHGDRPVDDIVAKFATRKDKYIIKNKISVNIPEEGLGSLY